jgi:hypothetical protein
MSTVAPFLVLNTGCEKATYWLANQMKRANLTLLRTFNSNDVRSSAAACPCPHHGANDCNCQVMIFLVYQKSQHAPVSLVVHGYDQYTLFYLVDSPQQRADPGLEAIIRTALVPTPALLFSHMDQMAAS